VHFFAPKCALFRWQHSYPIYLICPRSTSSLNSSEVLVNPFAAIVSTPKLTDFVNGWKSRLSAPSPSDDIPAARGQMQVQIYEFSAKRENIFGFICFSANFLATQQRKMHFSLFSLLENLQISGIIAIFAARKERISSR